MTMLHCGQDGWRVFIPVLDCCTREVHGHALKLTGKAKTAERALEEARLARFGTRGSPYGHGLKNTIAVCFIRPSTARHPHNSTNNDATPLPE